MITGNTQEILTASKSFGWVLEPNAKTILSEAGLTVPKFRWAKTEDNTLSAAAEIGYPVVAKVVSPKALHKSDVGGVVVGIKDAGSLKEVYRRFSAFDEFMGVHVEGMAKGVELIIGAKIDAQFGPVVLLGIGGTGVEIYQDTAIGMAPLTEDNVRFMAASLKGKKLLEGYRGTPAVNMDQLVKAMMAFSNLVMDLADQIESIDLNPVMCTPEACIVADARIIL
jgi:succinyl-CoA synthetase beta subunit